MEEKLKQIKSNCKKVVLYGPESTGKTTLSIELAKHFKTNWVPEYAREYLQNIWDNECTLKDLEKIKRNPFSGQRNLGPHFYFNIIDVKI